MRRQLPGTVLMTHPSADLYGSDRVFLESVQGLLAAGGRVVVALPSTGPLIPELQARGAEVIMCNTVVLRKSLFSLRALLALVPVAAGAVVSSLTLLIRFRPHTVYVNTVTLPLWSVLPRLVGCRVVVHVHEAEQSAHILIRRAMAAPLLFSSIILINSRFCEKALVASQPRLSGRITVVDNAVSGPSHRPPRPDISDGVRLLFVGRLAHRKGVDVAVEALAELVSRGVRCRLDIVGAIYPGNEGYEEKLRQSVQTFGVSDLVRFHGFQSDVWPFLAMADIALVPSRLDEGFGNTAVEALLSARPVIVSDTSGLREAAAGYASAQFVAPSDPQAIADAVEKIGANWSDWSDRAVADSANAAGRHNPKLFQRRIAAHLLTSSDAQTKEET